MTALVSQDFSHGQNFEVVQQRAQSLGEETLNRTSYAMWGKHADRLGMTNSGADRLRIYRSFLTTGFGPTGRDRSRNAHGSLNRGRSGSRSTSRGRASGSFRRRRSPESGSDSRYAKRGRSSHRHGW